MGVQQLYMPQIVAYREKWIETHSDIITAENIPLFLPSAVSHNVSCSKKTQEYEYRLREAQAHDALKSLRHHLCVRTHLWKYKDRFITGQRQNTRARSTIGSIETRIQSDAARYRAAFSALAVLGPLLGHNNHSELKILNQEDIRGMSQGADGSSEGTRRLSWIWMVNGVGLNNESGMQEGTFISLLFINTHC